MVGPLRKVIEGSNMRKPVTYAAEVIGSILHRQDYDVKCGFLDEVLKNLLDESLNLMIRKNPETRLLIHAVCGSDTDSQKVQYSYNISKNRH